MNKVQGVCAELQRGVNHCNNNDYMKFTECHIVLISVDKLLEAIDIYIYKDNIMADIDNNDIIVVIDDNGLWEHQKYDTVTILTDDVEKPPYESFKSKKL